MWRRSSAAGRVFLLEADPGGPGLVPGRIRPDLLAQANGQPAGDPSELPLCRGRPGRAVLHQRHHRPAQGGAAHPPQPISARHDRHGLHAHLRDRRAAPSDPPVPRKRLGHPALPGGQGRLPCYAEDSSMPRACCAWCKRKRGVTRFYIVPTMVSAILELPNVADYDLSSLREVLIGGAPAPTGMCVRAEQALGCTVHGGFGMSETCPLIALPELPPGPGPRDPAPPGPRHLGLSPELG